MRCEFLQLQSRQLFKKIAPIIKPSEDVIRSVKAIIYLGTGQIYEDWKKAIEQFQYAMDKIIHGTVVKNNVLYCEKLLVNQLSRKTILGNELYEFVILCINSVKENQRQKRSKSGQTSSTGKINKVQGQQVSTTKIGALVKSYKEEFQKMMESRPSLKSRYVEERINKNIEQIKEKIKKTNKTFYFVSPKREQQVKAQSLNK